MKLYEIDQAIMDCLDQETGEILDEVKLDQLLIQKDKKIENVALWIKNLVAEQTAIKHEREKFQERENALGNKIDSLKRWLNFATNQTKFETAKVRISFRKSQKVDVVNEKLIPKKFIKITESVDKTAIKKMLSDGQAVKGCRLIESNNISIK